MHSPVSYTTLPEALWTPARVHPFPALEWFIGAADGTEHPPNEWIRLIEDTDNSSSIAQAYGGHQFGHWNILGDGRALLLREIRSEKGDLFDIGLKGSGRTPYSRGGDGRAQLGYMLKEFLISEWFHAMSIPTTRSLGVLTTGETVQRERPEPGAVLIRKAKSHIRVGTFQFAAWKGGAPLVQSLLKYTASRHFGNQDASAQEVLSMTLERQAKLIAAWMSFGFIHGVMNTDNMAISGETIDFGPCAFQDEFRFDQVYSQIDQNGRYAYENQPHIALWNLYRLAEALLPLIDPEEKKARIVAKEALDQFDANYNGEWLRLFQAKLGISPANCDKEDHALAKDFLLELETSGADFTNSFLALESSLLVQGPGPKVSDEWMARWRRRIPEESVAVTQLQNTNPRIIPRTHWIKRAIDAALNGDRKMLTDFHGAITNPMATMTPEHAVFMNPPLPHERVPYTTCGT
jgi:serine/tyrosine/threonine adenylyltransferase